MLLAVSQTSCVYRHHIQLLASSVAWTSWAACLRRISKRQRTSPWVQSLRASKNLFFSVKIQGSLFYHSAYRENTNCGSWTSPPGRRPKPGWELVHGPSPAVFRSC